MSELRKGVGTGAIVLLPIACCIGLPLLVAAGIGVAALAWGAGVVAAFAVTVAAVVLLARWRARTAACRLPSGNATPVKVSEQREEVVQR
jgi:hypothetical protein